MKLQLLLFVMYVTGYGLVYLVLHAIGVNLIVWLISYLIAYNILTSIHKLLVAKNAN